VDTGKLQLMTIHEFSVSFVFRHHRYSRWKDKIISTIQELEFKYLIVSGGLSEEHVCRFYKQIAEMAKHQIQNLL
jgi:hypothetical protein